MTETADQTKAKPEMAANLDPEEVRHFAEMADDWWNAEGSFKPLHRINPVRLSYIRDRLCRRFQRDAKAASPLSGLSVLDIGCGGGLICEPLRRLGADMTGIDPAAESIAVARTHAERVGLDIAYEAATAEELAAREHQFDAVLAMEVVEHVPDVPGFVAGIAPLVKPGGMMILSTINRTLKAYALAIVAAEYVLRWVPAGTHQWDRFVTPDELNLALRRAGLKPDDVSGMTYNPLTDEWRLSRDSDVNYFVAAHKPAD